MFLRKSTGASFPSPIQLDGDGEEEDEEEEELFLLLHEEDGGDTHGTAGGA